MGERRRRVSGEQIDGERLRQRIGAVVLFSDVAELDNPYLRELMGGEKYDKLKSWNSEFTEEIELCRQLSRASEVVIGSSESARELLELTKGLLQLAIEDVHPDHDDLDKL